MNIPPIVIHSINAKQEPNPAVYAAPNDMVDSQVYCSHNSVKY